MRIDRFRFGEITIGGQNYTDDLMLLEGRIRPKWWRKEGHLLQLGDLEEAFEGDLDALIVGTGCRECMKVAPEVMAYTRQAGIELLAFETRAACQTFNHLLGKRKIVAALHLTC
jgi:hypothetical protein